MSRPSAGEIGVGGTSKPIKAGKGRTRKGLAPCKSETALWVLERPDLPTPPRARSFRLTGLHLGAEGHASRRLDVAMWSYTTVNYMAGFIPFPWRSSKVQGLLFWM
jgi:hypothetical protein